MKGDRNGDAAGVQWQMAVPMMMVVVMNVDDTDDYSNDDGHDGASDDCIFYKLNLLQLSSSVPSEQSSSPSQVQLLPMHKPFPQVNWLLLQDAPAHEREL